MSETELLSTLVGDIYDAALDPNLWPGALGGAARYVNGYAGALIAKNTSDRSISFAYDDGTIDRHFRRLYGERYSRIDPSMTAHFLAEIGEPVATVDYMALEEFYRSRLFTEWAQPQGLIDYVGVALDKSATSVAMFGVFRHERDGVADETMRRRMRLVAPHFRRAVLIGQVIDLKAMEARTFADTLDGLSAALFLVDAEARIVHANAAGLGMLSVSNPVRSGGGRLVAVNGAADKALREVFLDAGQGDAAVGIKGIAVSLTATTGERYVAHVLPLTSRMRGRFGADRSAVAALFIRKAVVEMSSPPEIIARTYGLTPTELRVLIAVVEIGGAPEVAEVLGIAETTVKFHLRNLFEKTGSRRQADLVKLVASFASPLAG
jgi:DNA-binding CsgD family transcriptional regulator